MGTLSRIRTSRNRPLSTKRQRELQILTERDVMTVDQFKNWQKTEAHADASFMDLAHILHCSCGSCSKLTIVEAVDKKWLITTKHRTIIMAKCPKCSADGLRKIEYDVNKFLKNRPS